MVNSQHRQRARSAPGHTARFRQPSKLFWFKHGGGVIGTLIGGLLRGLIAKLVLVAILAVVAYFGITKGAGLIASRGTNTLIPGPQTTVSGTAVLAKLTGEDDLHVATGTYEVNVQITQSVHMIPCFLVCNQMTLTGTGTDDEILNLGSLSISNISIDKSTSAVTLYLPPPTVGPAIVNPLNCKITDSHGIVSGATESLHSNPNGYDPLYAEAEAKIHGQALQDPKLLAAGENNARADLIRLLGSVGVKQLTVNFI